MAYDSTILKIDRKLKNLKLQIGKLNLTISSWSFKKETTLDIRFIVLADLIITGISIDS